MAGTLAHTAAALGVALLLAACRDAGPCFPPPTPNLMRPDSLVLRVGERGMAAAFLYPNRCVSSSKTIVWSISDSSRARVEVPIGDSTTVLGVAPGEAILTAKLQANPGESVGRPVTVLGSQSATAQPRRTPTGP